ncbi:MAG TPA: PIN domain-containing protein [Firmicutes bacterium]|nr:PIN domain-containing protein [Bacillota bacterium]
MMVFVDTSAWISLIAKKDPHHEEVARKWGELLEHSAGLVTSSDVCSETLTHLRYNAGHKVMLHSCGSVRDLIPDLIEMGLDGLDPIQVRARGMNIEELKQEYGSVLTFRGSIDTQQTLPYGTPEDVKREVIDRICKIAPGGGFILNSSQNLLPEIPLENIITMYRTAYEYGHYDSLGQRKTA